MSHKSGYLFHTPTKKDQLFWSQRSFKIRLDMPDMDQKDSLHTVTTQGQLIVNKQMFWVCLRGMDSL